MAVLGMTEELAGRLSSRRIVPVMPGSRRAASVRPKAKAACGTRSRELLRCVSSRSLLMACTAAGGSRHIRAGGRSPTCGRRSGRVPWRAVEQVHLDAHGAIGISNRGRQPGDASADGQIGQVLERDNRGDARLYEGGGVVRKVGDDG